MARSLPPALVLVTVLILTALPSSSAAVNSKRTKSPPSSVTVYANTANTSPSSSVFQINGDVYPNGHYYVTMPIGVPPKPYFLDVDTGSDLMWLQCDAPCVSCSKGPHPWYKRRRNSLVPCKDPLCVALHESIHYNKECTSPDQCDYEIQYADNGWSKGILVSDASMLRLTNSSIVRPQLAFGCGYDQHPGASPTDGILGLGSGQISIISQLKTQGVTRNVIGHCLGRSGGFLFFGGDLVPPQGVTWASMSPIPKQNYYSTGKASFFLGNKNLGITESQPVVFDSGSSYTYFTNKPYQEFLSALKNDLSNKPLKEAVGDPALPICWKGAKPFKLPFDVKNLFKSLFLNFVMNGGKPVQMEIPPENYLIISKLGNACLGILNGTEVGLKDFNVIGDISMQDLAVIYDNEKQQIGWARANCNRRPPKSGTWLL